jgi:hypothetical protein
MPLRGSGQSVFAGPVGVCVGTLFDGFHVVPGIPGVFSTFHAEVEAGVPFTVEATTSLGGTASWMPILTTNLTTTTGLLTDWNARSSNRFYRVRQP